MSLLGHWQLGFDCGVSCIALNRHCRCHWFYMIIVVVGWEGMVVIETCLDDMHSFFVSAGSWDSVSVGLGVEDGVNGRRRWAVEWFV